MLNPELYRNNYFSPNLVFAHLLYLADDKYQLELNSPFLLSRFIEYQGSSKMDFVQHLHKSDWQSNLSRKTELYY